MHSGYNKTVQLCAWISCIIVYSKVSSKQWCEAFMITCIIEDIDCILTVVMVEFTMAGVFVQVSMVHKAVTDILNMGVEFRRGWERGVAQFDLEAARELEEGFTKRCHFLVSCLNLATRRGSFLYRESHCLVDVKSFQHVWGKVKS